MIFIDTGAFVARYRRRDQHHGEALAFWGEIERSREPCCTSTLVVAETLTLLGRWVSGSFAADKGRRILDSGVIALLRPDEADERRALDLLEKYADQRLSFTDCLSFVLMRARRIQRAFTFDHHFAVVGFITLPAWSVHDPGSATPGGPGEGGEPTRG